MSLDKSLKSKNTLERHRNVLTRAERIEQLQEMGRWAEDARPIGLPKVAHRKLSVGKKEKTIKTDTDTETASETTASEEKS